jgi:hypothetical protein
MATYTIDKIEYNGNVYELQDNKSGYITEYTETDPRFVASPAYGITANDITNWNGKSDFSGSYTDLTDKPTIPTKTIAINDSGYIYNGQAIDSKISGVGLATSTNLLTSTSDTYALLRGSSTNPLLGLKCGNNLWYAQAMDNYFYFGPTSTKAMRLDQNGNALFVGTVQADGDLTLYTPSGNSPGIIFQRGTLTDNYNDWKIYDKSGFLYFAQRGSGSSAFGDVGYIDTGGVIRSLTIPWGSVINKPNLVNTITTEAGAHVEITDATGNVKFKVPTNTSHLTNDSGYITSADLPEGPLVGNTSDITPTQVLTALQAGRDVYITYNHELYGTIAATYFDYSNAFSVIISNVITVYYDDEQTTYMLFQLSGYLNNNTWGCHVTTLAEKSDIPTVANSNTTGITASTTATKTTLGTAGSVIGVQSSTTTASKVTVGSHSTDYGVKTAGSGSYTQGSFTGGSLDVTNHILSFTPATHGTDSHTHTAPTLGSKIPTVSASDVTVPIKDTGATSIPNVSVASATVTITDPGHTHQLSN